jgi:hypothetical protein
MFNLLANIGACGVDNRVLFFVGLVAVIGLLSRKGESRNTSCGCGDRK